MGNNWQKRQRCRCYRRPPSPSLSPYLRAAAAAAAALALSVRVGVARALHLPPSFLRCTCGTVRVPVCLSVCLCVCVCTFDINCSARARLRRRTSPRFAATLPAASTLRHSPVNPSVCVCRPLPPLPSAQLACLLARRGGHRRHVQRSPALRHRLFVRLPLPFLFFRFPHPPSFNPPPSPQSSAAEPLRRAARLPFPILFLHSIYTQT